MNSKTPFSVGTLTLGGCSPVVVQSMTNTDTADVAATAAQCRRMVAAGAQMVRITVPSLKEIPAIQAVKALLRADGCNTPLIADVHFNPKVAEAAASIVEKVRINPGNYTDKRNFSQSDLSDAEYQAAVERMGRRAKPLFDICKAHGTALRIGINHGSLCGRVTARYGNTPEAMVQSALEWLDICEYYDFHKTVFSMKSSNPITMIEATMALKTEMGRRHISCPLHIGVTEAGSGLEARVKSAAGIGTLLLAGAGDTVRVSLTEPPENEMPAARTIIDAATQLNIQDIVIKDNTLHYLNNDIKYDDWAAKASVMAGYAYYKHHIKGVELENPHFRHRQARDLEAVILQACRIRMSKTEFIACPSCGRTQYDIQTVLSQVKAELSGYPGLKIGVMGCIVNGPGEMADADFGIVGASHGLVCVYEGKRRITDPIPVDTAIAKLKAIVSAKD